MYSYWTIAALLLGTALLIPIIMGFFGGNKFPVEGKTVLLTGASEGMGKAVAIELSQKGANIIIVSRSVAKLQTALQEIQSAAKHPSSQRFKYISADLSETSSAPKVLAEARAWNNGNAPDILWNIAGSSAPDFYVATPVEKLRWQMDINFWAAAEMAHGILREWLDPAVLEEGGAPKHLIFTTSVVAFYAPTGYSPYAPAKAALRSLGDTLQQEMLLYGGGDAVKIHMVCPGTILSPGYDNEQKTKPAITMELEETDPQQTPAEVAAAAIKGLEAGMYLITINWLGRILKSGAWGAAPRNNWFFDTLLTFVSAFFWMIVQPMQDGQVKAHGKKFGHPSTYVKKA